MRHEQGRMAAYSASLRARLGLDFPGAMPTNLTYFGAALTGAGTPRRMLSRVRRGHQSMARRAKKTRVSWRRWQQRELPVLDDRLCVSCRRCADLCPTECLAMAGPLPWMPRPADCISCTLCVLVCPAQALRMAAPADTDQ